MASLTGEAVYSLNTQVLKLTSKVVRSISIINCGTLYIVNAETTENKFKQVRTTLWIYRQEYNVKFRLTSYDKELNDAEFMELAKNKASDWVFDYDLFTEKITRK